MVRGNQEKNIFCDNYEVQAEVLIFLFVVDASL